MKIEITFRRCVIAAALLVSACGAESSTVGTAGSDETATTKSSAATKEAVTTVETPRLTGPQRNAVRSATQYLSMTGFSRDGLINQLSSDYGDSYTIADATVAVDSLTVDWNENAVKSARQYLSMSGYSCDGLIEQLSSSYGDKYTMSQATYGARNAGACS